MDFSLIDYLDEGACYTKLVELLHPDGLACPRCGERQRLGIHRRHRDPVLDHQCGACLRVFNAWTETALEGTHRRPSQVLMILHGIAKGTPTAQMARELGCDRRWLLALRHRLQGYALRWMDRNPLGDDVVEADQMSQNAGERGIPHEDPEDPPRRRANNRRGHGTFATDRPPIAGSSAGSRVRSVWRSWRRPAGASWGRSSAARAWRGRWRTRTSGAGTTGSVNDTAVCTGRWTTRGPGARGPSIRTVMGCARSTAIHGRGCGRASGPCSARSVG